MFFCTFRLGLTVTAAAVVGTFTTIAVTEARTYAWLVILGRAGFLNNALQAVGLTDEPLRILLTETGVFIGLVQLFFPLMGLPLFSSLENLPRDVIQAGRVLGASWLAIVWTVILPLTREGLVIGGTLVFVGSATAYVTPSTLGGSKVLMLETVLYQRSSRRQRALLGPSGCGKTTTMRSIAGLMKAQSGRILLEGRAIRRVPASRRGSASCRPSARPRSRPPTATSSFPARRCAGGSICCRGCCIADSAAAG